MRGTMSKIGLGGTLLSIFWGFVFIAIGIFLITKRDNFEGLGVPNEFCFASSILIFGFGGIMIFIGLKQLKGIKEGKNYPGPPDSILP